MDTGYLYKTIKAKKEEFKSKGLDQENPVIKETLEKLQERADYSEVFAGVMVVCSAIPAAASVAKWIWALD